MQQARGAKPEGNRIAGTALLSKAMDIVECIAATERRLKIGDIEHVTGYARPTLYRILAALSARGMVHQDPRDHAWALGPKFTQLAGSIAHHTDLITLAARPLQGIGRKFGEAVNLGILAGNGQQTVARWTGSDARPVADVGGRKPLYCTALGKALLAFQPERSLADLIAGISFERLTERTVTDAAALVAELESVRSRGFALDSGEIIDGTACVAVPIFDDRGGVAGAASVSGPAFRMTDPRRFDIAADLLRAAGAVAEGFRTLHQAAPAEADPLPPGSPFSVDRIGAFGATAILPTGTGDIYCVIDGPGARVLQVEAGRARVVAEFSAPVQAGFLRRGKVHALSEDRLWRVDPGSASFGPDPVVCSGAVAGADALVSLPDGTLFAGVGSRVLHVGPAGDVTVVAEGRDPATGLHLAPASLCHVSGGAVVLTPLAGHAPQRRIETDAPVRDFAVTGDGGAWVTEAGRWEVSRVSADGGTVERLPLPVPAPSAVALTGSGRVLVGSDRFGLSSAQLDLAPLSGGVFSLNTINGHHEATGGRT